MILNYSDISVDIKGLTTGVPEIGPLILIYLIKPYMSLKNLI